MNNFQINGPEQFAASFHKTLAALAAEAQSAQPNQPQPYASAFPAPSNPFAGISGPSTGAGMPSVLAGIAPPAILEEINRSGTAPTPPSASIPSLAPAPRYPPGASNTFWPVNFQYPGPPQNQQQPQQLQRAIPHYPGSLAVDLLSRLPALLLTAVQVESRFPAATAQDFRNRLEEKEGPLPEGWALPPSMPPEAYAAIRSYPNAGNAYKLLRKALAYSPQDEEELRIAQANGASIPQPRPKSLIKTPETVPVTCNELSGTFWVENQIITCNCASCVAAAKGAGLKHLAMSPNEFERHAGLAGSRKWKLTIRAVDPNLKNPVLGRWLELHGIEPQPTRPIGLIKTFCKPVGGPPPGDNSIPQYRNTRSVGGIPDKVESDEDGNGSGGGHIGGDRAGGAAGAGRPASRRRKPPKPEAYSPVRVPPQSTAAAGGKGGKGRNGEERPGLRSPSGKPWMSSPNGGGSKPGRGHMTGSEPHDVRVGDRYQAKVPTYNGPPGRASVPPTELAKVGEPGPDDSAALASASGPELKQAQAMPRDATRDLWMGGAQARSNVTGTAGTASDAAAGGKVHVSSRPDRQRVRRAPGWMKHTIDPNAALGGKALVPRHGDEDAMVGFKRPSTADDDDSAPGGGSKRARQGGAAGEAPLRPEIAYWRLTDSHQLSVTIKLGSTIFRGLLSTGPARAPSQAIPRTETSTPTSEIAAQNNYFGGGASDGEAQKRPRGRPPGSRNIKEPSYNEPVVLDPVKQRTEERRRAAEAEYDRLLEEGPPPDAKCALCHSSENDDIPDVDVGAGGRSQTGLGKLMLVRVSALNNAWVHEQCARWSPEVFDPTGEGILEGVDACIRRGRMIRCRTCNEKGATLGCLKKTCKNSFHLSCARRHGCLLQLEPYIVACPEHVNQLPPEVMREKRKSRAREKDLVDEDAAEGDTWEYGQQQPHPPPPQHQQHRLSHLPPTPAVYPSPQPYHHPQQQQPQQQQQIPLGMMGHHRDAGPPPGAMPYPQSYPPYGSGFSAPGGGPGPGMVGQGRPPQPGVGGGGAPPGPQAQGMGNPPHTMYGGYGGYGYAPPGQHHQGGGYQQR